MGMVIVSFQLVQFFLNMVELRNHVVHRKPLHRNLRLRFLNKLLLFFETGNNDALADKERDHEARNQQYHRPQDDGAYAVLVWNHFGRFPDTLPKEDDADAADGGIENRAVTQADANTVFELIEE